jgi:uncharacterized protein (TIGR00255 family)
MPLFSMTGFARSAFGAEGAKFSWELKSVNARGLDVKVRLPAGLDHLEPDIRALTREQMVRGSCFFALQKEGDAESSRLLLNEEALALVVAAARRLAAVEGIAMPTADGLLAIPGVLRDGGAPLGEEAAKRRDSAVLQSLRAGIEALKSARAEEGKRLRAVLAGHLDSIAGLVEQAASIAEEAPAGLRARVQEQVALLTAERNGLDPDRLHQEAVLLATRADIREELDRLRSHVASARNLLDSDEAVGRRFEFLSQEFNREANTLCSKAFDRRLTAVGVELKTVIDQFREQVQNLE